MSWSPWLPFTLMVMAPPGQDSKRSRKNQNPASTSSPPKGIRRKGGATIYYFRQKKDRQSDALEQTRATEVVTALTHANSNSKSTRRGEVTECLKKMHCSSHTNCSLKNSKTSTCSINKSDMATANTPEPADPHSHHKLPRADRFKEPRKRRVRSSRTRRIWRYCSENDFGGSADEHLTLYDGGLQRFGDNGSLGEISWIVSQDKLEVEQPEIFPSTEASEGEVMMLQPKRASEGENISSSHLQFHTQYLDCLSIPTSPMNLFPAQLAPVTRQSAKESTAEQDSAGKKESVEYATTSKSSRRTLKLRSRKHSRGGRSKRKKSSVANRKRMRVKRRKTPSDFSARRRRENGSSDGSKNSAHFPGVDPGNFTLTQIIDSLNVYMRSPEQVLAEERDCLKSTNLRQVVVPKAPPLISPKETATAVSMSKHCEPEILIPPPRLSSTKALVKSKARAVVNILRKICFRPKRRDGGFRETTSHIIFWPKETLERNRANNKSANKTYAITVGWGFKTRKPRKSKLSLLGYFLRPTKYTYRGENGIDMSLDRSAVKKNGHKKLAPTFVSSYENSITSTSPRVNSHTDSSKTGPSHLSIIPEYNRIHAVQYSSDLLSQGRTLTKPVHPATWATAGSYSNSLNSLLETSTKVSRKTMSLLQSANQPSFQHPLWAANGTGRPSIFNDENLLKIYTPKTEFTRQFESLLPNYHGGESWQHYV